MFSTNSLRSRLRSSGDVIVGGSMCPARCTAMNTSVPSGRSKSRFPSRSCYRPARRTTKRPDELIGCSKRISEPPKRGMRTENGQKRNDMRLQSHSGDRDYRVFMRVTTSSP